MRKEEAEFAIRGLIHKWVREAGVVMRPGQPADYYAFKRWAEDNGYGAYWTFRSPAGAGFLAELWFDQELKQMSWR